MSVVIIWGGTNLSELFNQSHQGTSLSSFTVELTYMLSFSPLTSLRLEYSHGQFHFKASKTRTQSITLETMIQTGLQLKALENYPGFIDLVKNLNNKTQIFNTILEIESAFLCHKQPSSKSLHFSKSQNVNGRIKNPEFTFDTTLGEVIGECKKQDSSDNSNLNSYMKVVEALSSFTQIQNFRVEIFIRRLETGNSAKNVLALLRHISNNANTINTEFHFKEFSYIVLPSTSHRFYTDYNFCNSYISIGTTPVQINNIHNYSLSIMYKSAALIRRTEELIKDASKQIPKTAEGIIFIEPVSAPAGRQAALFLLNSTSIPHIQTIFLRCEDHWEMISRNTPRYSQIFSIF